MVTGQLNESVVPLRWVHRAIIFVDIVDSTPLFRRHPDSVLQRWTRFVEQVRAQMLIRRGGRFVKSTGDGFLLEFPHAAVAATCALEIQQRARSMNDGYAADAHILLRAGLHVGDLVDDLSDLLGDAANYAARLTSLAQAGEVVVSDAARTHLVPGVDPDLQDRGEHFVKGIDERVRVWRLADAQTQHPLLALPQFEALRPAIAVMPFDNVDGHDPTGALGDALAADVVSSLSRQASLQVVSSLSMRALKRREPTVPELAAQLGVAYVASGRYLRQGNGLRLMLELTDARNSIAVWADGIDTSAADVFDPQVRLADRLAGLLARQIVQHETQRATTLPLPAVESYTLLFGAIAMMNRLARDPFERAQRMLEHLAERLGRHGVAHAWLAMSHVLRRAQGWSDDPARDAQMAMQHVGRSLDSDPTNGLALSIGGLVHGYLQRDLAGAGRLYDQALEANPSEPLAWLFSSTRHAYLGHGDLAEKSAEQALRLSPLDPMSYFFDSLAATALCGAGQWERAAALAHRSLQANRVHASSWRTLAYAQANLGHMDGAREAVRELLRVEPGLTVATFLERFPGRDGPMAQPWADAMRDAGLPD